MYSYPYQLSLDLLGAQILVRCQHKVCADGIRWHFSPHVRPLWRTPDVIVDCTWPKAERYLFRARPDKDANTALDGVRIHAMGRVTDSDWMALSPPLPPFELPPFQNRFVGLHAACVEHPSGALIIAGHRGSGKTTLTLRLVNDRECALLTDEVVCIMRRSYLVAPFAMALGLAERTSNDNLIKKPIAADHAVRRVSMLPVLVTHCLILNPMKSKGAVLSPLDRQSGFRSLLDHHLNIGCSMDESIVTLLDIARRVNIARLDYGSYDDLCNSIGLVMKFVGRNGENCQD